MLSASSSSCISLPSYSPSSPAPSYSCEPAGNEQRLDHTPRSSRLFSNATFIKKFGKTTLLLNDQEENVSQPSFGRHSIITGSLCFDESHDITEVVLKVCGKLHMMISEGGSKSIKTINSFYKLWKSETASSSSCPSQIPFNINLPQNFQDHDDVERPLPPSYKVHLPGASAIVVDSSYCIQVAITRTRHRKFDFWKKTKRISIPFTYRPRTRSHRPIILNPCFFSSIKTSPEEWYQSVSCIKMRPISQLEPISCHLLIPASRIYGLAETIPFHVQLSGPISSLKAMYSLGLDRVMSMDSSNTASSSDVKGLTCTIRVFILRQVSVEVRGTKSWRNVNLGEAVLYASPPSPLNCYGPPDSREEHIDWEGELRIDKSVTIGGFTTTDVQVKDFIIFRLTPPNTIRSDLLETQLTIPIKIVTDSYEALDPEYFESQ